MVYSPVADVLARSSVPSIVTSACASGAPALSATRPRTVAPCAASAAGARSIRTQRILPPLYICRGIGNEHWRLRYGALQEPSSDARFPPPHLHRATRNAADPAFHSASRLPHPARSAAGAGEGPLCEPPGAAALGRRPRRRLRPPQRQLDRRRAALFLYSALRLGRGDPRLRPRHRHGQPAVPGPGADLSRRHRAVRLPVVPVGPGLQAPGLPDPLPAPVPALGAVGLL